ncbi:30S ribosomal protein S15 [Candidatus Pacearchaeota archaeon]|nr:30S ribosomal protein S15 [Candidatus Pacearchaeota archaeon]
MTAKNTLKKPIWLKYTEQEIKEIILKLVEKQPELTAEKIGLILRDNYGIPKTKIYGFSIGEVLKEAGKYENPDLKNLTNKVENLEKHLGKNHGDKRAGRSVILSKAKLKKVEDYSKK